MFTQYSPWRLRRENVSFQDDIFLLIYLKLGVLLWI